jgi:hypothetical protein
MMVTRKILISEYNAQDADGELGLPHIIADVEKALSKAFEYHVQNYQGEGRNEHWKMLVNDCEKEFKDQYVPTQFQKYL